MKTFLNAFLLIRAARANKSGLVAAAIALNGGWRSALGALALAYAFQVLKVFLPVMLIGIIYLLS